MGGGGELGIPSSRIIFAPMETAVGMNHAIPASGLVSLGHLSAQTISAILAVSKVAVWRCCREEKTSLFLHSLVGEAVNWYRGKSVIV